MMKKYIAVVMLIVILFMSSCTQSKANILPVVSLDYPGLTEMIAGDMDEDVIRGWTSIDLNPYWECCCHVSLSNDELIISNKVDYNESFTMKGNIGYFVGVNIGHSDGWVKWYPTHSAWSPEIVGKPKLVADESCQGFIKVDNNKGYLFTYDTFDDAIGYIYELVLPDINGEWQWQRVGQFSSCPLAFTYNEDTQMIYVATSTELASFSIKDNEIVSLADLSLWQYTGVTSMVELNDKLYLGMCMGVYEYDLNTKQTKWYPMDYDKYLP